VDNFKSLVCIKINEWIILNHLMIAKIRINSNAYFFECIMICIYYNIYFSMRFQSIWEFITCRILSQRNKS